MRAYRPRRGRDLRRPRRPSPPPPPAWSSRRTDPPPRCDGRPRRPCRCSCSIPRRPCGARPPKERTWRPPLSPPSSRLVNDETSRGGRGGRNPFPNRPTREGTITRPARGDRRPGGIRSGARARDRLDRALSPLRSSPDRAPGARVMARCHARAPSPRICRTLARAPRAVARVNDDRDFARENRGCQGPPELLPRGGSRGEGGAGLRNARARPRRSSSRSNRARGAVGGSARRGSARARASDPRASRDSARAFEVIFGVLGARDGDGRREASSLSAG